MSWMRERTGRAGFSPTRNIDTKRLPRAERQSEAKQSHREQRIILKINSDNQLHSEESNNPIINSEQKLKPPSKRIAR